MSDWIDHNGTTLPVAKDAVVQAKLRSGAVLTDAAEFISWRHRVDWPSGDIVAYRFVQMKRAA